MSAPGSNRVTGVTVLSSATTFQRAWSNSQDLWRNHKIFGNQHPIYFLFAEMSVARYSDTGLLILREVLLVRQISRHALPKYVTLRARFARGNDTRAKFCKRCVAKRAMRTSAQCAIGSNLVSDATRPSFSRSRASGKNRPSFVVLRQLSNLRSSRSRSWAADCRAPIAAAQRRG